MSQALATITQSRRPAQTFRVGYDMPAREFESGTDVLAASRAVYERMHPKQAPVVRFVRPADEPTTIVVERPPEPMPEPQHGCPIDMLAQPSWRFLVALAALKGGVKPRDIIAKGREKHLCAARHEAAYLIAGHTSLSLPRIGLYLGGRDHTTILSALRKFPKLKRAGAWQRKGTTNG